MTRDELHTTEIVSDCEPDPVTCYERVASEEQAEEPGRCLRCPVSSWMVATMFAGSTN